MAARLKKVSELMHSVLALDQRLIAEIRSFQVPPNEVHDIMKATFLLLGNYDEETRVCISYFNLTSELEDRVGTHDQDESTVAVDN